MVRRLPADEREDGLSLVEMLVVMILLGIVGTILVTVIVSALKQETSQTTRAAALSTERTAMDRLTRDLRTASYPLLQARSNSVVLSYTANGVTKQITWAITTGTGGVSQLSTDEVDTTVATGATQTVPRRIVMPSYSSGATLFTFYDANGNPLSYVAGSTTDYPATVVQTVKVTLSSPLKSGPPVVFSQVVEPRNNAGSS